MVALKACKVHCVKCLHDIDQAGYTFAGVHAIRSVGPHALTYPISLMEARRRANLKVDLVLLTKVKDPARIAEAIATTGYDWIQLHAPWDVHELDKLRSQLPPGTRIITLYDPETMSVPPDQLLAVADFLIVDHHEGGTGRAVPSASLGALSQRVSMDRTFLAGGMTSANVRGIIDTYAPYGIDAQSALIGPDGGQDYRRLVNFAQAAKGHPRTTRVNANSLPLERYNSGVWAATTPAIATGEDLVAKVNLIESLESRSSYRLASASFWSRVESSIYQLSQLSDEVQENWLTAALVIFANVRYLEQEMLTHAWRGLFLQLSQYLHHSPDSNPLDQVHLFENDPSGLTGLFCHVNHLEGRLDTTTLSRIEGTDRLADMLLGMSNRSTAPIYTAPLLSLFRKREWVLLVDKTLSGHSLRGDLERLILTAEIAIRHGHRPPRIWILAQVATEQAVGSVADLVDSYAGGVEIRSAIRFTATESLNSPGAGLISSPKVRDDARQLCEWFGARVVARDPALDRMRQRSGDNLEFGYRSCGLTLVDHDNCPTDSLPLLWYGWDDSPYVGPYPRVHSRIGEQSVELSLDKWGAVSSDYQVRLVDGLVAGESE